MKKIRFKNDLFKTIIIILILVIVIDLLIFSIAVVVGPSMWPTLSDSDQLVFVKLPYFRNNPKRGDIIIFSPPKESGRDDLFVKRVVAIENDKYSIIDGVLYIDGRKIAEDYICDEEYINRSYPVTKGIVPENMVFVMGDNRNNSNDSRRFCCIKKQQIEGRVILRIWPLNSIKIFKEPYL
ncbi:signal peptidase I [Natronincola ferrireducens]|uniref:Signal peptidase I n=1 Tax=Natronincola ferrireducens TaxID=393762 RepID=A0A1G9DYX3_9FIRM|nr:signal peptidase I [Natronincola ferrireducens]SDK69081.1 signal peptidase I [Natronincola ferrireducens]